MANDTIVRYIGRKFKGHGMARLVEVILKAKGYTGYISPEGPDKGIDILAAPGPLGFGRPYVFRLRRRIRRWTVRHWTN